MIQTSCVPTTHFSFLSSSAHVPSHHTGCCFLSFPYLVTLFLSLALFPVLLLLSTTPPSPVCPLISLFSAGCCWTFSTSALSCSSPPTSLCSPLVALICLSLVSSQDAAQHFLPPGPQERALFDVPSPLNFLHLDCLRYRFSAQQKSLLILLPSFLPSFLPS